jgi:stage V sporulation protein AB
LGGTIGNVIIVYSIRVPIGITGIFVYGFFCGVFVGCLAMALAEVAKVVPVFAKRIKLVVGMPFIVLGIALGKCIGAFYQLYWK